MPISVIAWLWISDSTSGLKVMSRNVEPDIVIEQDLAIASEIAVSMTIAVPD